MEQYGVVYTDLLCCALMCRFQFFDMCCGIMLKICVLSFVFTR